MAAAAAKDIDNSGPLAALGSSAKVRGKQLQLAREGCDFLVIRVDSDEQKDHIMQLLARVPVRYVVHYRRLVIEDLIDHIPSATADRETARQA